MATSNAMGTGKNAATKATAMIPAMVTGVNRACCGSNSTTSAPRTAASNINGSAIRKTYQKLFAYERPMPRNACDHVSVTGTSIGQAIDSGSGCARRATAGAKTKISKKTVASFRSATDIGNSANVIANTTTLRAGEANIAPSTDSLLIPDASSPRAMGATQFVQTPSGTPATVPSSVLR